MRDYYKDSLVYRWLYLHDYVCPSDVKDPLVELEIIGSRQGPMPLPRTCHIAECVDNALDRYAMSRRKIPSDQRRAKDYKHILCSHYASMWIPAIIAGIAYFGLMVFSLMRS